MHLQPLITFDEATIVTKSTGRSHDHDYHYHHYMGQSHCCYQSLHGDVVRFGLLRSILCDLLRLDDGDYLVDLGSGCGIITNCGGVYKPLVNSVGIEFQQAIRIRISNSTSII